MGKLRQLIARYRHLDLRGRVSEALAKFDKFDFVQFGLRRMILPWRVSHVSGPRRFTCGHDEVVAISVVRNGELWVKSFLAHHRRIGIRRFVILDNGSTDRTIAILSREDDVTLLRTTAPYKAYENTMKRYLAERYCRGRWCLCVDIDELFEFPLSKRVRLSQFVGYLDRRGYNAVITQMLDMFSEAPLASIVSSPTDDIRAKYRFYDISNIQKTRYEFAEPYACNSHGLEPRIMMHWGGIRKTIFGTNNGLTKVSLFLMDGHLKPFILWHHAKGARIADISCVLLHYPFVNSFYTKVAEAVKIGRYGYLTSNEYKSYLRGLERSPTLVLRQSTARMLTSVDDLLRNAFLVASQAYMAWADSRPAGSIAHAGDAPAVPDHERRVRRTFPERLTEQ